MNTVQPAIEGKVNAHEAEEKMREDAVEEQTIEERAKAFLLSKLSPTQQATLYHEYCDWMAAFARSELERRDDRLREAESLLDSATVFIANHDRCNPNGRDYCKACILEDQIDELPPQISKIAADGRQGK